jgi:hypothetical protein
MEPLLKRKRITKVNARKVQESDIALGERIRARCNQIVMSQEELGKAIGVSFSADPKVRKRHEPHKLGTPDPNR